jgi:hypothetical protein
MARNCTCAQAENIMKSNRTAEFLRNMTADAEPELPQATPTVRPIPVQRRKVEVQPAPIPPSRAGLKHIGGYFELATVEKVALLRARLKLDNSVGGSDAFGWKVESAADIDQARREMEFDALNQSSKTKKCVQDCVHIVLAWERGETPTREEMEEACKSHLKAQGMGNAKAIFVSHNDEDYFHVHIVASKINPATSRAYDMAGSWRKASLWAEEYEREHGGVVNVNRASANELRRAIRERDVEGVLEAMTKHVRRAGACVPPLHRRGGISPHRRPGRHRQELHHGRDPRCLRGSRASRDRPRLYPQGRKKNLAGAGFEDASTIHRALTNLNRGLTKWDQKTVIMVDEAGMVDTSSWPW